jgi:uncharacterized protein (DUF983 family)
MKSGKEVNGFWSVGLYATCPHCDRYVDVTDHGGFWYKHSAVDPVTYRSTLEVVCPACGEEFIVSCDTE